MSNLKEETLKKIEKSGHSLLDIMFIGSVDGKYRIDIDTFLKISDFHYDDGLGAQRIARDLIVYFNDGTYMFRKEYDGAERWEYLVPKQFNSNDDCVSFDIVGGSQYSGKTLEEMNNHEKYDEEGYEI